MLNVFIDTHDIMINFSTEYAECFLIDKQDIMINLSTEYAEYFY